MKIESRIILPILSQNLTLAFETNQSKTKAILANWCVAQLSEIWISSKMWITKFGLHNHPPTNQTNPPSHQLTQPPTHQPTHPPGTPPKDLSCILFLDKLKTIPQKPEREVQNPLHARMLQCFFLMIFHGDFS